jgi:hypothetical protein
MAEPIGFKINRIVRDPIPRTHKYFIFTPSSKAVRLDRILELHRGRVQENQAVLLWQETLNELVCNTDCKSVRNK